MSVVGLRQLAREMRDVIEQLERDGEPVVITRHGKPVAALTAVSEEDAASYALALAPEFVASREQAAKAIAAGEGEPASQVLAELPEDDEESEIDETSEFELAFPAHLIEQLADVAEGSMVARGLTATVRAAPIHRMNLELINTLVGESLASVADRVRTVNENIIAEVGDDSGQVSVERYTSALERVTAAQRLAISRSRRIMPAQGLTSQPAASSLFRRSRS